MTRTLGSVRGAVSDGGPYRDPRFITLPAGRVHDDDELLRAAGRRRTRSTGCCTASASGCSRMRCSLTCSPIRAGNCVPPMIVAVVMVLQRIEGCSDREAVDRFAFDARWKYAAGGLGVRLSRVRAHGAGRYARPAAGLGAIRTGSSRWCWMTAKRAGLVGRRRVLDSTALYDAVATMDTVTLIRSAIRGLLAVCDRELGGGVAWSAGA